MYIFLFLDENFIFVTNSCFIISLRKKGIIMSIFKKVTTETSNDYYEAYKAQLETKKEKKELFSFANILKVEIAAIALGFFLMHQNHISVEFKSAPMAMNDSLPMSVQANNSDKDLVVTFEENEKVAQLDIREDDLEKELNVELASNDGYAQSSDIDELINSLKAEVNHENSERVVLSQNSL